MCKNADKVVLVADKGKFNTKAVMQAVAFNDITDVVTNSDLDPIIIDKLSSYSNIKLHLV